MAAKIKNDKRKPYVVKIAGVEHTFLLAEDDVKRYPDAKPATKQATPQNK